MIGSNMIMWCSSVDVLHYHITSSVLWLAISISVYLQIQPNIIVCGQFHMLSSHHTPCVVTMETSITSHLVQYTQWSHQHLYCHSARDMHTDIRVHNPRNNSPTPVSTEWWITGRHCAPSLTSVTSYHHHYDNYHTHTYKRWANGVILLKCFHHRIVPPATWTSCLAIGH